MRAERILVGAGGYCQLAVCFIESKPAPPRSLERNSCSAKLFYKILQRAKFLLDSFKKLAFRALSPAFPHRRQICPKNGMIDMPSAIKFNGLLQSNHRRQLSFALCFVGFF